jgi:hypothetical protein
VLRYLSQLYKTITQNVPDRAKNEGVHDVIGYLRAMLERVDTSLIEEWEGLLHPELRFQGIEDPHAAHRILAAEELARDPRALVSRVRAELHQLVRAISRRDWEEAVLCVRQLPADESNRWSPDRFEDAMAPFFERYSEVVFDHSTRLADKTRLVSTGDRTWEADQILVDPDGENLWCIETIVDLRDVDSLDGPLIAVTRIGT